MVWVTIILLLGQGLFVAGNHLYRQYFPTFVVEGSSMNPTYTEGDTIQIVSHGTIERFDVVVVHPPDTIEETVYLKRVIGLPGEHLAYREGKLYINGEPVADPFGTDTSDFDLTEAFGLEVLPANSYFVIGDNRQISKDSRTFGYVIQQEIHGIVTKGVPSYD